MERRWLSRETSDQQRGVGKKKSSVWRWEEEFRASTCPDQQNLAAFCNDDHPWRSFQAVLPPFLPFFHHRLLVVLWIFFTGGNGKGKLSTMFKQMKDNKILCRIYIDHNFIHRFWLCRPYPVAILIHGQRRVQPK